MARKIITLTFSNFASGVLIFTSCDFSYDAKDFAKTRPVIFEE